MTTLEQIKTLSHNLSAEDREKLVEYLSHETNGEIKKETKSLRGSWKVNISEDFDIDEALKEIRGDWEKEIEEIFK